MKKSSRPIAAVLFVTFLLVTIPLEAQAQLQREPATQLTLGVVFQSSPDSVTEYFRPLVNYAARQLTPTGAQGMVVVASTAAQMTKLLEEKRVDFYMESPYPTYVINRLGAARLLLRRWKGGVAEYHSLIFTNKESGVARLEDLRGKIIAFEDPGSTSGYFLPKAFPVQERLFRNGEGEPRSQGLGQRDRLHLRRYRQEYDQSRAAKKNSGGGLQQ